MDLERVVEENKGLVYKVASEFHADSEYFQELVQIGYIALIEAYKRFNIGFGYKFSTYAVYYIRGYIMKFMRKFTYARMIRIPDHAFSDIKKLQEYSRTVYSFETPVRDKEALTLGDTLIADDIMDDRERIASMQKILEDLYKVLNLKEKIILEMRYFEDMTLNEIGKILGVTKERVRQIENKALAKMQKQAIKKYGKDYKKLDIFN